MSGARYSCIFRETFYMMRSQLGRPSITHHDAIILKRRGSTRQSSISTYVIRIKHCNAITAVCDSLVSVQWESAFNITWLPLWQTAWMIWLDSFYGRFPLSLTNEPQTSVPEQHECNSYSTTRKQGHRLYVAELSTCWDIHTYVCMYGCSWLVAVTYEWIAVASSIWDRLLQCVPALSCIEWTTLMLVYPLPHSVTLSA